MIKSTTRQAKENIKNYVLFNFAIDEYNEEHTPITNDFEQVAKAILDNCFGCLWHELKRGKNFYQIFEYYCQGLPTYFDTCYYYNRSAIADLGDILEQSEQERNQYTQQQAEQRLTQLIYREISKKYDFSKWYNLAR